MLQIKDIWDLSPLLSGDDDSSISEKRKFVEDKSHEFMDKWNSRNDHLHDPEIMAEALAEYEWWDANCGAGGIEEYYFWLRSEQDQNNPKVKAKLNKAEEFSNRIKNDMDFFELRISKIPQEEQAKFLENPRLAPYRHFLERLFSKSEHLLSEQEEKIMTLKEQTSYSNWKKMLSGFIAKEERDALLEDGTRSLKNLPELQSLISSQNKDVRDCAARGINEILIKHADAAEAEMNSLLANRKTDDEIRRFSRPDAARHLGDDIESKTVDLLIEAVSSRFDIPRKFYALKASLFGVERLEYHERNVPYGHLEKKYEFREAADLVHEVFTRLDEKFGKIFEKLISSGQIDVYPRTGKRDGAFCTYGLLTHPTYVLLNHTGRLNDVLTLAHEMGHAINNELSREKQNSLNFGTSTATAEVASTFMEDFVLERILEDADDELRLSIMMTKLNDDISTIFRQVACYRFESEIHKKFRETGYLPKEEIGKIFSSNMESYMGDAVAQSPGSENWWVYWSHIRNYFYVYSYASGLLISKSLQASVKKDPVFIEKVKEFLAAGRSDSAKNIFSGLGIDISRKEFWDSGMAEIEKLLESTIDLAKRLGKIPAGG
jgi:oligoendopeptidase F